MSLDDAESHKAFIAKNELPFPLVVDDGAVADAFEVPHLAGFAKRHSFLIGSDGNIANIWRDVDPGNHASEVLAAAKAAK